MFLLVLNCINWLALLVGVQQSSTDVATFFLGITIANFFFYFLYYQIMKRVHNEQLNFKMILFGILSVSFGVPALHYFTIEITNWDQPTATSSSGSAALSRDLNADCILMDFYDTHDLWHVLSAFGLFFGALLMLTLDDDLLATPRHKIRVQ